MRIVFTAAVFDLLHDGHVNLLRKMRAEAGDDGQVIVILHDDRSTWLNKQIVPVQSFRRRKACLKVTGLVDDVLRSDTRIPPFEGFIAPLWQEHNLIFMRGDDWIDFPGKEILDNWKIPIKYVPYTSNISSSFLREELKCRL